MKIFIAEEKKEFLPDYSLINYPPNNTNGNYTVEQDFYNFIKKRGELLTDNYLKADFIYIPVYWQRYCYNNNYHLNGEGLSEIQKYLDHITSDVNKKFFTIACPDNGPLGTPRRREMMRNTLIFNASMGDEEVGISNIFSIPLITSEWNFFYRGRRNIKANFVGRKNTHPIRKEIFDIYSQKDGYYLVDGYEKNYKKIIAKSLLTMAPRGCSVTSFRFFESMQLGTVPVLISAHDARPFKDYINWDEISFFTENPGDVEKITSENSERTLLDMGRKAREIYYSKLNYGKWCQYVLNVLTQAMQGKIETSNGHKLAT